MVILEKSIENSRDVAELGVIARGSGGRGSNVGGVGEVDTKVPEAVAELPESSPLRGYDGWKTTLSLRVLQQSTRPPIEAAHFSSGKRRNKMEMMGLCLSLVMVMVTVMKRPNYHPLGQIGEKKVSNVKVKSNGGKSTVISQLWHTSGRCPEGTIPMRRTRREDLLRASSITSYGKKKHKTIPKPAAAAATSANPDIISQSGHQVQPPPTTIHILCQ
ncbi:hypothetical protein TEA_023711 [Camellia sinensis var. sinensis]|uniref:Neprosin activation peptide domain-containing protein n=1 Tax=Camellia sinensis var. sinensis TaxID=542762 RepID=A0A4S4DG23_CAMSN|nr:hypothetical protein TEA_023711 [Camellia sinensis var. sinensis]